MFRKFSLRTLLAIITVVATALYVFVARPSLLAQEFVLAVSQQDYERASAMMRFCSEWVHVVRPLGSEKADRVYAEMQPREWGDVWGCRRRIRVTVSRHREASGGYVDWTEDTELVAGLGGVEIHEADIGQIRLSSSIPIELPARAEPYRFYDQTLLP